MLEKHNDGIIHIMGAKLDAKSNEYFHFNWRLTVYGQFIWQCERVIWIGFYQNGKNNNNHKNKKHGIKYKNKNKNKNKVCLISWLPKDIVKQIIVFLRDSIFD